MMKDRKGLLGLIGVCCSSLCLLGLPVFMALIPTSWMGSVIFEWAVRAMIFVFLYFSVKCAYGAYKCHRKIGPLLILFPTGFVLVSLSFYLVPRMMGWVALSAFLFSWVWDRQLLRKVHGMSCHKGGES